MEMVKIAYVLPHYDASSAEHFAHLLPFLEQLGRRVALAVIVERAEGIPPIHSAARIDMLPKGRPWRRMAGLAALLIRLRRLGYRKIFVRISTPSGLVAGLVGRLLGIESYYWNSGQGKNAAPPWGPGLRVLLERIRFECALLPFYAVTRVVHHFVTGPRGMADYYTRRYGVNPRKILVFANDIDLEGFRARLAGVDRTAVRDRLGYSGHDEVILFVGRVSPLKGGEYLLPIADRVLSQRKSARLLVVGDIHLPHFRSALAQHEHRDRITITGPVANTQIAELYAAADLFIIPSKSEGFPRVLLECMAARLPFVAFDVGGIREIAPIEHRAVIVPPYDVDRFAAAILTLLQDPDLARRLTTVAGTTVERYATPAVVDLFTREIAHA